MTATAEPAQGRAAIAGRIGSQEHSERREMQALEPTSRLVVACRFHVSFTECRTVDDLLPRLQAALAAQYAIAGEIGSGGMATVFAADDLKHHRPVAVKVLRPELAAALGAVRFLREISIAAQLVHPHILPLFDSGAAGGFLYYVTPHAPGGSLRQRIERGGRLQLADALQVARDVGSALDYAHRQGYIHRDVKPENILFSDGHAVLADFGIARALGSAASESITDAGIVLGTPEYMSPEQAAGEDNPRGESDTYSLACVTYEMLAGEAPLRGINARATMAKQVTETPRPLRERAPGVPLGIDRAIMRALGKDPAERFPSVTDFISALHVESSGERPAVDSSGRLIAVLPFVNASPEPDAEYLSDGITDELIYELAKVTGLRVASRTSVFALDRKGQDVRTIGEQLGAAWILEGTVRRAGQRLRITTQLTSTDSGRVLWSERFDRTFDDVLAIQEEIARTIVETLRSRSLALVAPPSVRRTSSVAAYGAYLKGRYEWNKRTPAGVAQAIRYFEQAIAEDPGYAQAYAGLSDSYALEIDYRNVAVAGGFAHAEEYARKALALDETVAETHASLAWSYFIYDWRWEDARREFRRAIELDPQYPTAHHWYAFWLSAQARHGEAIAEGQLATELDPTSLSIRRSFGWLHYYARRFDEACVHVERAVAMNPTADESYRVLALCQAMAGRWADAEQSAREAVTMSAEGPYNRATLAYVLARSGQRAAAGRELAELESRARDGYVSPVSFATVHLGLENWDAALDWMERAHAERRGWMAYLRVNPIMDGLRGRTRFEALVRQMKL